MIRAKSILIKLNLLQLSDKDLLALAASEAKPECICCPDCGAKGSCRQIFPYRRMIITIHNGQRVEEEVSIPRVQCLSCKGAPTHAVLSDALIPFRAYTLRFILYALNAYLKRTTPVRILCEQLRIAVSTLYEWIHLFIEQHNRLCKALDRIAWVCKRAVDRVENVVSFPSLFFATFQLSFLQRPQATPSVPVADSG